MVKQLSQEALNELEISRVDHLPIVSAYCNKLDLITTIDHMVPSNMDVSVGTIIQGMVIDTLSGRTPLYRLPLFFKHLDTELLLNKKVNPEAFSDYTVGRALDMIFDSGTMKIFSTLAIKAVKLFSVDLKHVHFDTTSVSVWGDYEESQDEASSTIKITQGHSKDHRPDLKQFVVKMLCAERNIPIFGGCEDGNASDKTINKSILTTITKHMAQHKVDPGAFVYIADSALVAPENLAVMGSNLFITRLPFTYNACEQVVRDAVGSGIWDEVGSLAKTKATKKNPVAHYRVCEQPITLYDTCYRAIVVHSSAHDQRRQKRMEKELKQSRASLEKQMHAAAKIAYFCEADAEAASQRLKAVSTPYHEIQATVVTETIYERGRPSKTTPRKIKEQKYRVQAEVREKPGAIEDKKLEAGCFVLLTNAPTEGPMAHTAKEVLVAYKEQHGIERNFGFLKDPLIVNDLFLKKPERIEVLGLILLISLLVWNLMEREMRKHIKETEKPIEGWDDKKTTSPTSFMMSTKFIGIMVVVLGETRKLARKLDPIQLKYLSALGLTPDVFIHGGEG